MIQPQMMFEKGIQERKFVDEVEFDLIKLTTFHFDVKNQQK